ncbi:YfbU family protein [Glutamicibacter ardleyensis]|uniref:YfbU family protein n=1 Tax=Glutamicibacter ardleyensis TaxID=225894 RepID=UPI003FCEED98
MATITIRLKDETRDRIAEAAESQGVLLSDYIRGALETHLALEPSGDIGTDRSEIGEEISLEPFQRKVLQLLHRNLLATMGGLEDSYYDHAEEVRALKVLENGFAGEYSKEFVDINDPMTRAECELVWDIFDMFRVIQASVSQLGKDGWNEVKVGNARRYGSFGGFDFNDSDEARLANYAEFLVKNDRWTEQIEAFSRTNGGGNSHSRMLPTYLAMLRVFKPIWRQNIRGGLSVGLLSVEDVERILLASPGAKFEGE